MKSSLGSSRRSRSIKSKVWYKVWAQTLELTDRVLYDRWESPYYHLGHYYDSATGETFVLLAYRLQN